MPLIAVAPTKFARGVEGADSDWRVAGARPASYEVVDLVEALERTYTTDAHLVAYTMRSSAGELLPRQPRINKPGLSWVLSEGFAVEQVGGRSRLLRQGVQRNFAFKSGSDPARGFTRHGVALGQRLIESGGVERRDLERRA